MSITVFTVVFNNYGMFVRQWLENLKKQVIQPKAIIVLGKEPGITAEEVLKLADGLETKVVHSESDVMGTLRNCAVEQVDTNYRLYFSVDDILLPEATKEILDTGADVVALKYKDIATNGKETLKTSWTFIPDEILHWRKKGDAPGYVAVNGEYYYEDTEMPNLPFLFQLATKKLNQVTTENVVALYKRRADSHGGRSFRTGKCPHFAKIIDEYAVAILQKYQES